MKGDGERRFVERGGTTKVVHRGEAYGRCVLVALAETETDADAEAEAETAIDAELLTVE
jgi:hypothetical protein